MGSGDMLEKMTMEQRPQRLEHEKDDKVQGIMLTTMEQMIFQMHGNGIMVIIICMAAELVAAEVMMTLGSFMRHMLAIMAVMLHIQVQSKMLTNSLGLLVE